MDEFREFKGDEWLGRLIMLQGGPLRLIQETEFGWAKHHAITRAGRKAKVYRARRSEQDVAVKVFFRKFLDPINLLTTSELRRFSDVPGLRVCDREVIPKHVALKLGEPGLAFAILMPWISGRPWIDVVASKEVLSQGRCLDLARRTTAILAGLEARQLVHADISSSNVFIGHLDQQPMIELVDVEDMYHPSFADVPHVPDGTDGYGHPANVGKGCRNPFGDRFAGSILLVEMLSWYLPEIRDVAEEESLFGRTELCRDGSKFSAARNALQVYSPAVVGLFEQAWRSNALSECPRLADWQAVLHAVGSTTGVIEFPGFLPSLPRGRDADYGADPQFETTLASAGICAECSQPVLAGRPTGHLQSCSYHPTRLGPEFNQPPLLTGLSGEGALPPEFRKLLKKYSGRVQACQLCGKLVPGVTGDGHASQCPNCQGSRMSPANLDRPLPDFDDVSFISFNNLSTNRSKPGR
jgi:hypothetical protein